MVEQLINGIVVGSMYALVAIGYTLVFGLLDKLNLAHGDVFMFGGYAGLFALTNGLPPWVALVVAALVGGCLGLLIELLSFRKFTSHDAQITACLSTVALGMVITDLTQRVWGTEPVNLNLSAEIYNKGFVIFGTSVSFVQLGIVVASIALMIFLTLGVHQTKIGRFMRTVAENPTASSLIGIDPKKVTKQVFFISSALAGIAGMLLALRTSVVSSNIGLAFGIKALAVMAIGGLGDLRGAFFGGLAIGIIEAMAFNFGWGSMADMLVWIFLIITLIVKPSGLFVSKAQTEVRA